MMAERPTLRIALFCHSIVSDWNHGNAHFLRGLVRSLRNRGHEVFALEEEENWSLSNLVRDHGVYPVTEFVRRFPFIDHRSYVLDGRAHLYEWLTDTLADVDACLVHEWNPPDLVKAIGEVAARLGVVSLFHDTHHRAYTEPERVHAMGLEGYAAILAYGPTIADIYMAAVPGPEVILFHEGADTELFRPLVRTKTSDVVFIGNWGDTDRDCSTWRYLIEPSRMAPELKFTVFGVRYPDEVLAALRQCGITWKGWLPNYSAPEAYAASKMTVHIPRKEYVEALRGTPTIRVFEALACGVPLLSATWTDDSGLFEEGSDYIAVDNPAQMTEAMRWLATDEAARNRLGDHGRETVLSRHTCEHRAQELVDIIYRLRSDHTTLPRRESRTGFEQRSSEHSLR